MKFKLDLSTNIFLGFIFWSITVLILLLINLTTGSITDINIIIYMIVSVLVASIIFIIIVLKGSIVK